MHHHQYQHVNEDEERSKAKSQRRSVLQKLIIFTASAVSACLVISGLIHLSVSHSDETKQLMTSELDTTKENHDNGTTSEASYTDTVGSYGNHDRLHKVRLSRVSTPFESIWPDSRLPSWAQKHINYKSENAICFVHVGKSKPPSDSCCHLYRVVSRSSSDI